MLGADDVKTAAAYVRDLKPKPYLLRASSDLDKSEHIDGKEAIAGSVLRF